MNVSTTNVSTETVNEDLSSSEPTAVTEDSSNTETTEKVLNEYNTKTATLTDEEYDELIQEVQYIGQRLDNEFNISLVSMVGISLICGLLVGSLFANFFKY